MIDGKKLLDAFLNAGQDIGTQAQQYGQQAREQVSEMAGQASQSPYSGLAAGAAVGGLAAVLLGTGTGRQITGGAMKVGALAGIAALGYKAYQNWQAGKEPPAQPQAQPSTGTLGDAASALQDAAAPPPIPDEAFLPRDDQAREQQISLALVQAMIAAAKADGHIDATERAKITAKIDEAALDDDEKGFINNELTKPLDIDEIAGLADNPQTATEIYLASMLAIEPDTPAEERYLSDLAGKLGLDPKLVAHLHAEVGSAA
ncbi:MAG: tellurite resistance TerB family protein [Geminicoccaceae bacterium]